jgi:glycosyltransferase involved in cell wall biosynthesis
VAPLLTARGIQNKVLEAMAMAKPVIATPQAKEGIEAVEGEELLVASDATEFVAAVQTALSGEGRRFGERARERVVFHYTWSRSLEAVEQHLRGGMPAPGLEHARAKRMIAK